MDKVNDGQMTRDLNAHRKSSLSLLPHLKQRNCSGYELSQQQVFSTS